MNKYNSQALLVFPHQLFEQNPLLEYDAPFFIIEEPLILVNTSFTNTSSFTIEAL